MILTLHFKGSSTSGNHGHAGRPGKVGGSATAHGGGAHAEEGTTVANFERKRTESLPPRSNAKVWKDPYGNEYSDEWKQDKSGDFTRYLAVDPESDGFAKRYVVGSVIKTPRGMYNAVISRMSADVPKNTGWEQDFKDLEDKGYDSLKEAQRWVDMHMYKGIRGLS